MRAGLGVEPNGRRLPHCAVWLGVALAGPTRFEEAAALHLKYQRCDSAFDRKFRIAGQRQRRLLAVRRAHALTERRAAVGTQRRAVRAADAPVDAALVRSRRNVSPLA